MPKIQRKTQKIFCGNADNDQLAVFGSMATGTPVYTNDIEQLQNNVAYLQGWEAATLEDKAPFMEEMNGLQYGLSKQIAYTLQEGIPEYDANTTYYIGSIVKNLNDDNKPVLYSSLIDNNIDNALTNSLIWEKVELGGGDITDKITNCILEVPQRIKYILQNGTLTIKAGSVVIVPYGVEDLTATYSVGSTFLNENFKVVDTQYFDGKFFVWVELQSDVSRASTTVTDTYKRTVFLNIQNNAIQDYISGRESSGTEPVATNYYTGAYNTTTNLVGYSSNSTDISYAEVLSFPLLILDVVNSQLQGSVYQVFNGIGYIGKTVWVDKGVKGLIPNGRNADGTLKNIEVSFDRMEVFTLPIDYTGTVWYALGEFGTIEHTGIGFIYDEEQNIVIGKDGMARINVCQFGQAEFVNGNITIFEYKQPVRLVDYNELEEVHCVIETYSNGTSWYRIWSDGWCEQGGISDAGTITFLISFSDTNYTLVKTGRCEGKSGDYYGGANYNAGYYSKSIDGFVCYSNGQVTDYNWEAKGYI